MGMVLGYSFVVILGALMGAVLPLYVHHEKRLVTFLSFSAGVMLGAVFFHLLPEAFHLGGYRAFTLVPLGFVLLFLLERYVLVHACQETPDCQVHAHRPMMGLTAFFGLSIHTLFDGIALGSATVEHLGGLACLAITAHKIPSSVSLATILKSEGRKSVSILFYVLLFGLTVPLGASLFWCLDSVFSFKGLAAPSLAFSAGTFLYISVSDLIPHINRHGHGAGLKNVAGFLGGLLLMLALTFFTHAHDA